MKLFLISVLFAISWARDPSPALNRHWERFKNEHKKSYANYQEEVMRRLIFEENHYFIEDHNMKNEFDFTLGMNHLGDLTNKEYRKMMLGYKGSRVQKEGRVQFERATEEDIPDSMDWRTQGYVTEVKNQGGCGSCWAFSATGSLEGQHFKSTGKLVSLSEQNLVDCSGPEGNGGCNGGLMDSAFQYVKDNNGIDTEDSYPYTGEDGKCHFNKKAVGATVNGWVDVKSRDEEALRQAVGTQGPVSVAIDASSMFFQFYRGGVYNVPWCSETELDHGVLVVGYNRTFQGKDYWLVKNSWGIGWGIYGFIEMSRNKENQCGIATNASFPLV